MLRLVEMTEELRQAKHRVMQLALKDELTGVSNLRAFRAALMREFQRLARSADDLTLCLFDVDRFKPLNDAYGHPAGDVVLGAVARALATASREIDLVARIGGDEFAVLSPGANASVAAALAERLRRAPSHALVALPGGTEVTVTLTCGVASARQISGCTPDRLIAAADAALYLAKQAGRNCTVQATDGALAATRSDGRLTDGVVQEVIEDESSLIDRESA
jgi:diguanylate cyclase (GGDEF)-like protein